MRPELLADLADLFAVEGLEAHSNGDIAESERLLKISATLFERVLEMPAENTPSRVVPCSSPLGGA